MTKALRLDGEQTLAGPAASEQGPARRAQVSQHLMPLGFRGSPPRDPAADALTGRDASVTHAHEPSDVNPEPGNGSADNDTSARDHADFVTEIYAVHYNQLVRLAVLLVHDVQTAEEVVQDTFETVQLSWDRLLRTGDAERALSYLRQTVMNKSRSVLRHRKVVEMHPPKPAPDEPSAEYSALTQIERSAVTSALRALPDRQREALVLRYYGDLSEADIAKAMGISRGAVKSHTARAMAALKSALEQETY